MTRLPLVARGLTPASSHRHRDSIRLRDMAILISAAAAFCGLALLIHLVSVIVALDYPSYEIIFCVAHERDPVAPIVRALMAAHPHVRARLLVGDDRVSQNP